MLFPVFSHGNMAQPWVDGSNHSVLYGAQNCAVIKEDIFIRLIAKNKIYFAKYKIKYVINSNLDQTVPLLFVGIGLSEQKFVTINDIEAKIKKYKLEKKSEISYSENDSLSVNEEDLIYFEATLKKGENIILIEYDADLKYNTDGFIKRYELEYSLYPSKFWKSFGVINIELPVDNNLKIVDSNIGELKMENGIAKWKIEEINIENISIVFSKKTSLLASILISIHPAGISFIYLILMSLLHIKMIQKKYKSDGLKYKSILLYGILTIPIMFYVIFFCSFPLIDFILGQEISDHGYIFLFILTLPILMIIYGLIMWTIDCFLKRKYRNKSMS